MKLNPLRDRVVIRRDPEKEKEGQIYIPEPARQPPVRGTVIAIGPGYRCPDNGVFLETTLKPGDRVMFGPYVGVEIPYDPEDKKTKYLVMREEEVLGEITEEDDEVEDDDLESVDEAAA